MTYSEDGRRTPVEAREEQRAAGDTASAGDEAERDGRAAEVVRGDGEDGVRSNGENCSVDACYCSQLSTKRQFERVKSKIKSTGYSQS